MDFVAEILNFVKFFAKNLFIAKIKRQISPKFVYNNKS